MLKGFHSSFAFIWMRGSSCVFPPGRKDNAKVLTALLSGFKGKSWFLLILLQFHKIKQTPDKLKPKSCRCCFLLFSNKFPVKLCRGRSDGAGDDLMICCVHEASREQNVWNKLRPAPSTLSSPPSWKAIATQSTRDDAFLHKQKGGELHFQMPLLLHCTHRLRETRETMDEFTRKMHH